MRVLVCGGRNFSDTKRLFEVLSGYHKITPFTCLIHGAASGADTLAGKWASQIGIQIKAYPADWNKYGRSAGSVRNAQMLHDGKPDLVIAFPGGRGTANMIKLAKAANTPVEELK